jgi:hypothetical protein
MRHNLNSHWSGLIRPMAWGVALGLGMIAAGWHSTIVPILIVLLALRTRSESPISVGRVALIFTVVLLLHIVVITGLVLYNHHPHL